MLKFPISRTPRDPLNIAVRTPPLPTARASIYKDKDSSRDESVEADKRKHFSAASNPEKMSEEEKTPPRTAESFNAKQTMEKEQLPTKSRSLSKLNNGGSEDNGGAVPLVNAEKLSTKDMVAMLDRLRLEARNESDMYGDEMDELS